MSDAYLSVVIEPEHVFVFGTPALDEWAEQWRPFRRHGATTAVDTSPWYLVIHRARPGQPEHYVLSRWRFGMNVPVSFDVPSDLAIKLASKK